MVSFDYSRLTATCAVDSPDKAVTLPPEAYGSDELYATEVDRIFKHGWVPLCRIEQVPTPGSYYSIDILGTPLVVTRDRHSEIRVLSRNCSHRWMEVCSGAGEANVLQCPYHLWSFGLDGHLAGAPEMKKSSGFDRNDYPLKKFRHDVWKGFVFVNFDGEAEPLASQYAALDPIVDPYDLENYQTVEQTDWGVCDWDWKIMVDNFMECYHHMGPHRGSLEDRFPASMSYTGEVGDYFTTMWSQQVAGYPSDPPFLSPGADTLTAEHKDRSLIFIAYPLLQIAMGPAYMYWLLTLPLGGQDRATTRHLHVPGRLGRARRRGTPQPAGQDDLRHPPRRHRRLHRGAARRPVWRDQHGPALASRATALGVLPLPRTRTRNHQPHFHSRIGRMTPDDDNPERADRRRRVGGPRGRR
jgi:phenylpropionate dioxygenase-like ring-hydroxylating dioxygenase large terminal subunit